VGQYGAPDYMTERCKGEAKGKSTGPRGDTGGWAVTTQCWKGPWNINWSRGRYFTFNSWKRRARLEIFSFWVTFERAGGKGVDPVEKSVPTNMWQLVAPFHS